MSASAQTSAPITLVLDCSDTPLSSLVHVHETIPVAPGVVDLAYPRWVPGEHGPEGPILGIAGLTVSGGGSRIAWAQDKADMYLFHVTVPPGVSSLDVAFDFLGSGGGTYSENRLATQTIVAINWNQFLLYPATADISQVTVSPTVVLPNASWTAETALPGPHVAGNRVSYDPATLERLVDSPLDAGSAFKRFTIFDDAGFTNEIDAFADRPAQLEMPAAALTKFKAFVPEMDAIYGARHWQHYHFLLTISDAMPGNGVEHGSSSDDGTSGKGLTDQHALMETSGLLAHEFNHSWDGKYRRPADLATQNFQVPEQTELLWIYEGMTQFYGDIVPVRAGFSPPSRYRAQIANTYAELDAETGRATRSLDNTAAAAPIMYHAPRSLANERRRAGDFYSEGELLWLDVDARLLARSNGAKSLDGFAKTFFGKANTPPMVDPYTYAQFVAALNAYEPYDWDNYFREHVFAIAAHPPDPFEALGWKFEFADKPDPGADMSRQAGNLYAPYTLGANGSGTGTLTDVFPGSPAAKAGLGLNDTIVAVNGREFSVDVMNDAIKAAKDTTAPIALIVKRDALYRMVELDYHGGLRYPRLVRVPNTPDRFATVLSPKRPGAPAPTPEPASSPTDS